MLSRRQFVRWGLGSAAVAVVAGSCASNDSDSAPPETGGADVPVDDFSARFREFQMVMRQTRTASLDQIGPQFVTAGHMPIMMRVNTQGFGL